jgi:hypothetical protein
MADYRDMGAGRTERRILGDGRQLVTIPGAPNVRRQRVARALHYRQRAGELGLDDHQPFVGDAGIDDFFAAVFPVPVSPLVADLIDEPLARGKPALQSIVAPPLVCDLHDCPHAPQGCAFACFRAFTNKHGEQVRVVPVVFDQVIGGATHRVSGER